MQRILVKFNEVNWTPKKDGFNYIFEYSYLNTDVSPLVFVGKATVELAYPPDDPNNNYALLQTKVRAAIVDNLAAGWGASANGAVVEFV